MYKYLVPGLMAIVASPALAGGIERSPQSMNILFQQGNYLEMGASYARPSVSGSLATVAGTPLQGQPTGNIARSFVSGSLGLKGDISEQIAYAIVLDQPFGADTLYPSGSALAGSLGKVENTTLTAILRYKFEGGFSAHAGVRSSWTKGTAEIAVSPVLNYALSTQTDQAWGYLLGVAYEMPEIALRVALTYNSSITHTFRATETGVSPVPADTFNSKLPQSVNLEFQTGVAEDTLVFGSVRWVNWKQFDITPPDYAASPNPLSGGAPRGPLVAYQKNSTTYTLGVGRRFNENWSGSVSLAYDTGNGNPTSNLGPTGNRLTLGLGASYTIDNVTISGGMQYARIGNATTTLGSQFSKNSAIGAGIRIGYRF
ncbi:long-subunit fatty acid transport protein [Roseinatronobacter thiooxidans]|uniref:Long-subunit fatty acid transport protein n=1 Tax=Roseinatronobacter thiooxidans TaxID=121821 RepID=A0A2W7PSQ0_9RHOB|nr:outer membrane protein transport protein [Roseinatronobacter thiooxidans]PZX39334.1 long-subunit fatty acid transport protein [Roseinatronobacter thiooxidans]